MKKTYGVKQVKGALRQCDVLLAEGKSVLEVCRASMASSEMSC